MNSTPPRFYRSGDLPPRPEDIVSVRRALQRGAPTMKARIDRAGLSQTRTRCVIDALIAAGEVSYDTKVRLFSIRQEG